MKCPKCQKESSSDIECNFCGIVFDKYHKRVQGSSNASKQHGSGESWEVLVAIEDHKYPTLTRRYIATVIDVAFVLAAIILISYLFENSGSTGVRIRVSLILFLFFIYEPLCTSRLCTLGQKIMGVRIRRYPSMERISLLMAYARIIVKGLLGILSFFTLPFSQNRRAIHDMAARSIVIFSDKQRAGEVNLTGN
jgi:uncharacterized RDD family membrane protein YckC